MLIIQSFNLKITYSQNMIPITDVDIIWAITNLYNDTYITSSMVKFLNKTSI